jgi:aspartate kinase
VSADALRVHKLGGSVLPDAGGIRKAAEALAASAELPALVVVSACAGVTDRLLVIAERAARGETTTAVAGLQQLLEWHCEQGRQVLPEPVARGLEERLRGLGQQALQLCRGIAALRELTPRSRDAMLAFGELLSSQVVAAVLEQLVPMPVVLVDARHYVITDATFGAARPQLELLIQRVHSRGLLEHLRHGRLVVTQGFIGATAEGRTTTLGRGGSDFSAALFAAALGAEEVVVWKDVPGLFTADPLIVPGAQLIAEISAAEMRELAAAGAKVLHPDAVEPALSQGIRVVLRSVTEPGRSGTRIVPAREVPAAPLALAWRQPCWVYSCPVPALESSPGLRTPLLSIVSRTGSVVVSEFPLEVPEGWSAWEGTYALVTVVGGVPERWSILMLEALAKEGIAPTSCVVDPPWALRLVVRQEIWQRAVFVLHRMLLEQCFRCVSV